MNITSALAWAYDRLNSSDSPQLDAEVLLSFILGADKVYLYTHPERILSPRQMRLFKKLTGQRASHQPIAYLTHHKEFYGYDFYVDERVLIPRPETELLVETAIRICQTDSYQNVADIGTGSGCIAIALKKELPRLHVFASDINQSALSVAKKNAKRLAARITFRQGDLLTPFQQTAIDIFIANLPYLSHKDKNRSVTIQHEPPTALFAKKKGLQYIEATLRQITQLRYKPHVLLLEINPDQKKSIEILAKKMKATVVTRRDLRQENRFLIIYFPKNWQKGGNSHGLEHHPNNAGRISRTEKKTKISGKYINPEKNQCDIQHVEPEKNRIRDKDNATDR